MRVKTLFATAIAVLGLATTGAVHAAAYCQPGTSNADGMALTNVTYNGADANDCYGIVTGIPNFKEADLNGLNLSWGSDWTFVVKDEGQTPFVAGTGTFSGVTFTLQASGLVQGNWTLTATAAPGVLPMSLDFVAQISAGGEQALYYFDDIFVDGSDSGTWRSVITNRFDNPRILSHLSLFMREGDGSTVITRAPEPASLALVGLALLGAGVASRRRRV